MKARKILVVWTRGVAGPMGRPFLLGSRPRGPEHRELNELPALGTAPETQKTRSILRTIFGPRRVFRRLAHSWFQQHSRDSKTRQRRDIQHTIHISQARGASNADTHRTPKHAWSGFQRAPRGGGRTQPAHCLKSLVICDSRFESPPSLTSPV